MNFLCVFLKNGGPHEHLSATLHWTSAWNVIDSTASKYRLFDKLKCPITNIDNNNITVSNAEKMVKKQIKVNWCNILSAVESKINFT